MVVARVDQFEGDDLAPGDRGDLGVGADVGAEPGAGQDGVADDQQVALALGHVLGAARFGVPGGGDGPAVRRPLARRTAVAYRAAMTCPSTTSAEFAANTMSGRPGTAGANARS